MRKLTLLLFLLPSISFGQKFDVGLNLGPTFFSNMAASYSGFQQKNKLRAAIYSNAVLNMRINNLGLGLKIGSNDVSTVTMKIPYYSGPKTELLYAENITNISLSANLFVPIGFGDIYFGFAPGFVTYNNSSASEVLHPNALLASTRGSGYSLGLHAGIDFSLSKRFALNFEGDAQYTNITAKQGSNYPDFWLSYMTYPITVGAKYKFAIGKKYRDQTTKAGKKPKEVKSETGKRPDDE